MVNPPLPPNENTFLFLPFARGNKHETKIKTACLWYGPVGGREAPSLVSRRRATQARGAYPRNLDLSLEYTLQGRIVSRGETHDGCRLTDYYACVRACVRAEQEQTTNKGGLTPSTATAPSA